MIPPADKEECERIVDEATTESAPPPQPVAPSYPVPLTASQMALFYRRQEAMEFQLLRIRNAIEQGDYESARAIASENHSQ